MPARRCSPGSKLVSGDALPWIDLALGFAVAAAGAFLCIGAFMRFVERIGMVPFAVYRVLLGIVLLVFF